MFLLGLILAISTSVFAGEDPPKPICARSHSYAKSLLLGETSQVPYGDLRVSRFRLGLNNSKGNGRFGIGLCWWYSRILRASAYLVEFAPRISKPSRAEAKKLLDQLARFQPIVIPGYDSLESFTEDHASEFEAVLQAWQLRDTFRSPGIPIREGFHRTFSTHASLKAEAKEHLETLLASMEKDARPRVLVLDRSNSLHSYLVLDALQPEKGEVVLKVVDSEYPKIIPDWKILQDWKLDLRAAHYSVIGYPKDPVIAYSFSEKFQKDFDAIEAGLRTRCGPGYRIAP